jgi:hypothetical protein
LHISHGAAKLAGQEARMSYREISSRQTEFGWVIGPLLCVVGTVLFIGIFYFGWFAEYYQRVLPTPLSPVALNLFWGGWLLACLFSLWWNIRLKRVAVDGESIYVSDFLQQMKRPLDDVLGVTENRWLKIHPVTIEFAGETPWGHYVRFMPKVRFLVPSFVSHPIVGELRDMVSWAKLNERVSAKLQQDAAPSLEPEREP